MNEIKIVENNEVATDFKQVAVDYLQNMGLRLPQKYANQFVELSKLYGLNPFKREIYAVGYGDNYNIITGYEVYLKRAERIGKLDGWQCVVNGRGNDMTATLTIHRKDWKQPFIHTVYFPECVQTTKDGKPNKTWAKMPSFMLRKVAIAQGFRMCFPDEFGGMPYTSDELPEIEKVETMKSANIEEQLSPEAKRLREQELKQTQSVRQVSESALNLESLLNEYKHILNVQNASGNPYEMAMNVLNCNDNTKIDEMYVRCKNYILAKGVKVA